MATYVFTNNGLPIFDATGYVSTLNSTGQLAYRIGNVVTIKTFNVLLNGGASPPRVTPQPTIPIQAYDFIYFVTSQVVSNPQSPTMTQKFARTPGCVHINFFDHENKEVEALYKQATR